MWDSITTSPSTDLRGQEVVRTALPPWEFVHQPHQSSSINTPPKDEGMYEKKQLPILKSITITPGSLSLLNLRRIYDQPPRSIPDLYSRFICLFTGPSIKAAVPIPP